MHFVSLYDIVSTSVRIADKKREKRENVQVSCTLNSLKYYCPSTARVTIVVDLEQLFMNLMSFLFDIKCVMFLC